MIILIIKKNAKVKILGVFTYIGMTAGCIESFFSRNMMNKKKTNYWNSLENKC